MSNVVVFLQVFVIRPDSDISTNILTDILVCGFGFLEFNVLMLFIYLVDRVL